MSSPGFHVWEFDINYNPITRAQFEPVATFLETREGRLRPFYVVLPQHNKPQNSAFNTYCESSQVTAAQANAGSSSILISGVDMTELVAGHPTPGDFINIVDPNDINHVKAYKVTRVETSSYYREGTTPPTSTQRRIHITPPLVRSISSSSSVRFINPKFRVVQRGDTLEYDLSTDNLYQFSLNLEEVLP